MYICLRELTKERQYCPTGHNKHLSTTLASTDKSKICSTTTRPCMVDLPVPEKGFHIETSAVSSDYADPNSLGERSYVNAWPVCRKSGCRWSL